MRDIHTLECFVELFFSNELQVNRLWVFYIRTVVIFLALAPKICQRKTIVIKTSAVKIVLTNFYSFSLCLWSCHILNYSLHTWSSMNGLFPKTMAGYPVRVSQTGHLLQALFAGEINSPALPVVASWVAGRKPWVGGICQAERTGGVQRVGFAFRLVARWDRGWSPFGSALPPFLPLV
jgi:hypothetical protein